MIRACMEISWLWSPKDYWYASVSALIGASIGICWTLRQFKKQRKRDEAKCLSRLRACVTFNIDRLNQAKAQLEQDIVPNYPLDTAQMNHWISQSHDIVDADILRDLDWQRFQLDHLSSKFVTVSESIVLAQALPSVVPHDCEFTKALVRSLLQHVDTILKELVPLLAKIPENR